jgi:hypothetical protein
MHEPEDRSLASEPSPVVSQGDHIMLPPSTGAGSETTPLSPEKQQVAPGAGWAWGLLLLINLFTEAAPHRLP